MGPGSDSVQIGRGRFTVNGGRGGDFFGVNRARSESVIVGAAGADQISFVKLRRSINLNATRKTVVFKRGSVRFKGVNKIIGTRRADRMIGSPGTDLLYGLAGNDFINGRGGVDYVTGGPVWTRARPSSGPGARAERGYRTAVALTRKRWLSSFGMPAQANVLPWLHRVRVETLATVTNARLTFEAAKGTRTLPLPDLFKETG